MRKNIAVLLIVVLSLLFVACDSTKNTSEDTSDKKNSQNVTETANDSTDGAEDKDNHADTTDENNETNEDNKEEALKEVIPGTYNSLSLFIETKYELNDNQTYDKTSPEEKGTYNINENGEITFTQANVRGGTVFTPYKQYYYQSNFICSFEKDEDYGLKVTFDKNGRSNQTFTAYYEPYKSIYDRYVMFKMNEDGTFVIKKEIHNLNGILSTVGIGDTFEGTYTLNDDVLTLKWRGMEVPLLYLDGKLFFNVIEKVTENNAQTFENLHSAIEASKAEKFTPVDNALAEEITAQIQGEWNYFDNGYCTLSVEGNSIYAKTEIGNMYIENQGTFIVCKDFLLITYDNGGKAIIPYTNNNGKYVFSYMKGLEDE